MPLKAIVDGETIIAPDLSDEAWEALKARHRKGLPVTMACCGSPGHLRTSKRGTRHFYHATRTGCSGEQESAEHLAIKYLIYRACRAEGWVTCVEHPSPDRTWISDVCAKKDGRAVVFEVQLSPISSPDLEARDRKYRDAGIESYWLLDNYLGRSTEFESWYDRLIHGEENRRKETVPYLDPAFFHTGSENHLFIAKKIRPIGLRATKQTLYSTNNPDIPIAVWVREVLNGNYPRYLDESATVFRHKCQLLERAAPSLARLRDFYRAIVRDRTYEKRLADVSRAIRTNNRLKNEPGLQQKLLEIERETEWLKKEYSAALSDNSGLFGWKRLPSHDTPLPFFRLESEANIRRLEECIRTFTQWEASFNTAIDSLEREMAARG